MKRLYIPLLILLFGCSGPKLKKYVQRIDFNETVGDYYPPFQIDSIEAANDTFAYSFAVSNCYLQILVNKEIHKTMSVKSSLTKNEAGVDLELTVSPKAKDSINNHWRTYYSKYSKINSN